MPKSLPQPRYVAKWHSCRLLARDQSQQFNDIGSKPRRIRTAWVISTQSRPGCHNIQQNRTIMGIPSRNGSVAAGAIAVALAIFAGVPVLRSQQQRDASINSPTITGISVVGPAVKIFDHTQK